MLQCLRMMSGSVASDSSVLLLWSVPLACLSCVEYMRYLCEHVRAACFSHNLKRRGFESAQSAVIVWKPLEV